MARLQLARAVACTVVRKRTLHPNHQLLLTHVLSRVELGDHFKGITPCKDEAEVAGLKKTYSAMDDYSSIDDVGMFLTQLPLLSELEAKAVLGLTCLAMVIDARATDKGCAFYHEVASLCTDQETGATFPNNKMKLKEIALQFSHGKPIGAEAVMAAVGTRQVRTGEELLDEGRMSRGEACKHCVGRTLSGITRCFGSL